MEIVELETPHGTARAHRLAAAGTARAALVLGHGAGGSITAPDLQAVAAAALAAGVDVVLVEQPYRVAERRSAAPAKQLDTAWISVVEQLGLAPASSLGAASSTTAAVSPAAGSSPAHASGHRLPLIVGGRSSGARVACRTAAATGAAGVLCLAFPLVTPKGASRQDELDAVDVPVLIVQGTSDRFGMPEPDPAKHRQVVQVSGDHGLKRDLDLVAASVTGWLDATVLA